MTANAKYLLWTGLSLVAFVFVIVFAADRITWAAAVSGIFVALATGMQALSKPDTLIFKIAGGGIFAVAAVSGFVLWGAQSHPQSGILIFAVMCGFALVGYVLTLVRNGLGGPGLIGSISTRTLRLSLLLAGVVLLGAGILIMIEAGGGALSYVLIGMGVTAVVAALDAATHRALLDSDGDYRHANPTQWIVGAAATTALFAALMLIGASFVHTLAIIGVLTVIALCFLVSLPAETAPALLVAVFLWAALPTDTGFPSALSPHGKDGVVVALGDSFMSGEGAQTYYTGTNTSGSNECRRAPTAYIVRAIDANVIPDAKLVFLACSGARTTNIYRSGDGQAADEPLVPTQAPHAADGNRSQLESWKYLADDQHLVDASKVQWVFLSIGGNDSGFASLAEACVAPGNCSEKAGYWLAHLAQLPDKLDTTYTDVRTAFPNARIAVVPYPVPIADPRSPNSDARSSHCSATFSESEIRFLLKFVGALDREIQAAASAHGFYFVADMEHALDGRRLCEVPLRKSALNFISLRSVWGTPGQLLDPKNWIHNSFHPNPSGHAMMAKALQSWLATDPQPQPPGFEQPRLDGDLATSGCNSSTPDCGPWIAQQTFKAVELAGPTIVALAGALWLFMLNLWRWCRGTAGYKSIHDLVHQAAGAA